MGAVSRNVGNLHSEGFERMDGIYSVSTLPPGTTPVACNIGQRYSQAPGSCIASMNRLYDHQSFEPARLKPNA
jgi:hypothetical protein